MSPVTPQPSSSNPAPAPRRNFFKRYLITGLVIWIPLVITVWVLGLLVSTMDQTLLLLPE